MVLSFVVAEDVEDEKSEPARQKAILFCQEEIQQIFCFLFNSKENQGFQLSTIKYMDSFMYRYQLMGYLFNC